MIYLIKEVIDNLTIFSNWIVGEYRKKVELDRKGDMYTIIHESPHRLGNPRVVMPHQFVRLRDGSPKLRKNIVCLYPCLTSGWKKREAYPAPKVICVIPCEGTTQTLNDHVVAIFVLWVLDGHVLKDLTIRTKNIFSPGPHIPPLFHHRPHFLISILRSLSREQVCRYFLKPHRCHRHSNPLFK